MALQVEELGIQLRNEKPTRQHLSALKGQLLKLIDTLRLYRAKQVGPPERSPSGAPAC